MANPSTNVSRAAVTDLGGRKSIYSKYIYLSFLYTSRCHAHARALRVRTREGVCDVFGRRIGSARLVQQRLILRPCSHTLAHVGQCGVVATRPLWPPNATRGHAVAHVRSAIVAGE